MGEGCGRGGLKKIKMFIDQMNFAWKIVGGWIGKKQNFFGKKVLRKYEV